MNSLTSTRPRLAAAALTIASLPAVLTACGTTTGTGGGGATSHPAAPATRTTPAPSTSSSTQTAAAQGALSGTWNGHYSGSYAGTFHLTWHQSGTHLHGMITISNPGGTVPINGTVNGTTISFGTVGSTDITYSGTVSGSSMSGSYQIHTTGTPGGPWSASKA